MGEHTEHVVVGLGEVLWDCFADSRRPGGAPANVAFHAGQLGHRGVVCSRVGQDDLGRELVEYLEANRLETSFIQRDPDHDTGRVTVDTSDPARPSFVIHEDVAWDYVAFDEPLERLMGEASAVCFGTLAQRSPASRDTIRRCLQAAKQAVRVYDVNLRPPWYERDVIAASLEAAVILKLNGDEVDVLCELLDLGQRDQAAFGRVVQERFDVRLVCVTRGERGCLLIGEGDPVEVPGSRVDVQDAVGAGDAFTAALISADLRGWSLPVAARFANRVGGLVASRAGAMPDLGEELCKLIGEMGDG